MDFCLLYGGYVMKNAIKKAISILLIAVMVFGAAPLAGLVGLELPEFNLFTINTKAEGAPTSGTCGENLSWIIDAETGELTISGTGDMTDWSYSSEAPWKDRAPDFSVKFVKIENGVTSIGDYAFYCCSSLESITIGNSVTDIGDYAFSGCGLTSIDIPDSVINIGDWAFYDCGNLASVAIGNGVTSIGDWAFCFCTSLISITIPDSVTNIGECAFENCASLTNIDIPDGVIIMGGAVFNECTCLESVTIGNGVTSIGYGAFRSCCNLKSIWVDADNPVYSSDENGVLFNKDKTELLLYPAGKPSTSYKIPDNVTRIGVGTFFECRNLTSVTIPDSVTSIGHSAFFGCENLAIVDIPDGVTSIDIRAFFECSGLTTITIPASVVDIGAEAFRSCSLTGITVDEDNPAYSNDEHGALFNKDKTNLIYYPICNLETDYAVPDGVTSIGDYVFYFCWNLESITIPKSVKKIGTETFAFYHDITKDIYYKGTETEWNEIDICASNNHQLSLIAIHYSPTIVYDNDLILTPSRTVIEYGDAIILYVDESKIPTGGRVEWTASNGNFSKTVSADGTTCTITPAKKGDTTFTATIYDANGNAILEDEQAMTSKAGFFDKIIAFFKKLFGATKVIPQAFKGIY